MYCCFFDNLAFVLQIYALFIFYLACITNIGVCALCGIIFDVTEEMYIYIYMVVKVTLRIGFFKLIIIITSSFIV